MSAACQLGFPKEEGTPLPGTVLNWPDAAPEVAAFQFWLQGSLPVMHTSVRCTWGCFAVKGNAKLISVVQLLLAWEICTKLARFQLRPGMEDGLLSHTRERRES